MSTATASRGRRAFAVARLVAAKELRESLRDRRTLAVTVLFPLFVYPLLTLVIAQVSMQKRTRGEATPSHVALVGAPAAVARVQAALGPHNALVKVGPGDKASLTAGRIDALVEGKGEGASVSTKIFYDETRDESVRAKERVEARLSAAPSGCPAPFNVEALSTAAEPQVGGYLLSKALPLFLVMMVMLGAFYPAIDTTAGERERQTLEGLLVAPVPARWLLAGKLVAVTVVAAVAGVLHVSSLALTLGEAVRMSGGATTFTVPWGRLIGVLALVPPAALMLAALLVAVASHGRTFKEAQSFVTPVYLLGLVPGLVVGAAELPLTPSLATLPLANLTLAARALLAGQASVLSLAIVAGSTIVYAGLAVLWAERSFRPATWLARDGQPAPSASSSEGAWWRTSRSAGPASAGSTVSPSLSPAQSLGLFALAFIVLYFGAIPLQRRDLVSGLLLSEWLGIAALTLLFLRSGGHPLAATARFRWPGARSMAGAVLVGASAWVVVGLLTEWLIPVPKEVVEALRRAIQPADHSRTLAFSLFLMALTPAFCEELLFRGAILRGFLPLGRWPAIILTGVLFGLFHVDVWRLFPTALLGILLSWLAWRTDSLWASIAGHLMNNAALVILAHLGLEDSAEQASRGLQMRAFFAAALVLVAGLWLVGAGRRKRLGAEVPS